MGFNHPIDTYQEFVITASQALSKPKIDSKSTHSFQDAMEQQSHG
jgi:hypothetical protein